MQQEISLFFGCDCIWPFAWYQKSQETRSRKDFSVDNNFMTMTAVWCIVAYYLVNHPLIASKIRQIGHIILPFVLIGIGVYIILDSFVFSSLL
jgi:cadmium resistance protein CadD (predicted permease)